ncbi:TolC family protein [Aliarcobacter butzleri]|uniref:TolC family protein n=1 Tax=Aliarcobacter butzleri TaxID=28197 RepID=A0AAW6VP31_9BACT|nr:TolC family protein [Aliarcobacter butzleri]MDK2062390.1 TolC family protein [Aliarcobacter butzleri]MDK2071087.1 TolC family protein [Aliarcobacter butzleri]MDN5043828.1 TolC family protein [Aliarcobacter butzleri]MDN5078138.1 TolC family protein [Aliarcobacter butzleri]MDN5119466.1 TolC family protein [Aliarcobacter butzleri]
MKKFLYCFLFSSLLFANEKSNEVLMPLKNEIRDLETKSIEEKKEVNKYEWLNDLNISLSQSKDDENIKTKDYSLNLNQKILDFGGISSQIDYANNLFKQEALKIKMENFEDLNTLYKNFIDLKINDINILQNDLNIKNSEIEVDIKKSQYRNGQSDISDLNDAIMKKNLLEDSKMNLKLNKVIYENDIKKLTSYELNNLNIPSISLISKDIFLEKSTKKLYANLESQVSQNEYKKTKSKYLPALNLTGAVGYQDSTTKESQDYYNYGASITMPLNYTFSNDIEYSKLVYLQNRKKEELTSIELEKVYDSSIETIKQFENRINLALNDIKLYEELLELNQEEFNAGFKADEDVQTLKNSKEIRKLDIEKYKLNIKKELLYIYFQTI